MGHNAITSDALSPRPKQPIRYENTIANKPIFIFVVYSQSKIEKVQCF